MPLPIIGADTGTWGTVLNNFLNVAHLAGGGLSPRRVGHYCPEDYGAVGDGYADDTAALQACFNAAHHTPVYLGAHYKVTSTLKINQGQYLKGGSIFQDGNGGGYISFQGGGTANCIELATADLSRIVIEGLVILDDRTTPTSGSGIYLLRPKNHIIIRDCNIEKWKTNAIHIDGTSGDIENIHIHDCWVTSNNYGIYLQGYISNAVQIHSIFSDSLVGENTQISVIYLGNTLQGGATVNISSVKIETDNGCHMVTASANFRGNLNIHGLVMRGPAGAGLGGDMVRLEGTGEQRAVNVGAMSSVDSGGANKVCANFVNDVGRSITYTATNCRSMPGFIQGGVDDSTHFSQQMVIAGTGLNVAGALTLKTKAGAVSDADFLVAPPSGTIAVDTTNSRLYVKVGATWKYTALA